MHSLQLFVEILLQLLIVKWRVQLWKQNGFCVNWRFRVRSTWTCVMHQIEGRVLIPHIYKYIQTHHLEGSNLSLGGLLDFIFHRIFHIFFIHEVLFHYFPIQPSKLLSLFPTLSWPHAQRKWTSPLSDGVRQFDLASLVPRLIDCPGVYLSHLPLPCILNQGPCNSSPLGKRSFTPGLRSLSL